MKRPTSARPRRARTATILLPGLLALALAALALSATGAQPAQGADTQVQITDTGYQPQTVTITANSSVTWVNVGSQVHTASADDTSWDSGGLGPQQKFTHVFTTPGRYTYHSETDVTFSTSNGAVVRNLNIAGTVVVNAETTPPTATPAPPTPTAAPPPPTATPSAPAAAPAAPPAAGSGATPILNRQNLAYTGGVPAGSVVNFTLDYQPQLEANGALAPWLVRMNFWAQGAGRNTIGFTWIDQTDPNVHAPTAGATGRSVAPSIGGNITDVPVGTDTGTLQQAVLSAAVPGPFYLGVYNTSAVDAGFTIQLYPLLNGKLEPGINPSPTPIPLAPNAASTPAATPTRPAPVPAAPAPTQPTAPPRPAAAAASAPARATPTPQPGLVSIDDAQGFTPSTVFIKAGQSVTWANQGTTLHTATADDRSWDSGALDPGKTWSHTFSDSGTYTYFSATDVTFGANGARLVPFRGTVVVQPNS